MTLVVIPTTILLTLFAAKMMGYTINRVSLFALIFSIGILVDDAIVVIENIARHWAMKDGRSRLQGAIEAVAEVGNPTVVATLDRGGGAVADAVRLRADGPLYGADPGQCLGGDAVLLLRRHGDRALADAAPASGRPPVHEHEAAHGEGFLGRLYRRFATPVVRSRALGLDIPDASVGVATVLVCLLFVTTQRHGQAAAVRQQVGNVGGGRSARGRDARRHRAHAVCDRRRGAAIAGNPLDRDLCRHAGAVQFQRAGAALLYPRIARARRTAISIWRRAASASAPATTSRSICARG